MLDHRQARVVLRVLVMGLVRNVLLRLRYR